MYQQLHPHPNAQRKKNYITSKQVLVAERNKHKEISGLACNDVEILDEIDSNLDKTRTRALQRISTKSQIRLPRRKKT
jgi:hypothetical protein